MYKHDFPILQSTLNGKRLIYLDNAATTQKPQRVIDALTKYYTQYNANVHRGIHSLSVKSTLLYEDARHKVAAFLHAQPEEIVFTKGTTESLNLLAHSLKENLKAGDEIVLSEMEHHANIVPWQQIAKEKRVVIRYIPLDSEFRLDLRRAEEIISARTKIVSITQMSNVLGTINPIQKIITMAHNVGAVCIIDAAQSIAHLNIDVNEIDCDFLVFSAHKMYGPTGIGVLYGKKELLDSLIPYQTGGGMIKEVTFENSTWADIPERFEAGTPPIAGAIGLAEAVYYIQEIGFAAIQKAEAELTTYALQKLKEVENVRIIGPDSEKDRGPVISFVIEGIHPHDLSEEVDKCGIAVRAGHHCAMPLHHKLNLDATARVSLCFYNTLEEIDILVTALKSVVKGNQSVVSERNEIVQEDLTEEQELSKENIIDHYQNPRNKRELEQCTVKHKEVNPLCGDEITVYLRISDEKTIKEVSFTGHGCAISQASISLLTEKIKERNIDQIKQIGKEEIFVMLGIPLSPVREKCALLSLKAIQQSLKEAKI